MKRSLLSLWIPLILALALCACSGPAGPAQAPDDAPLPEPAQETSGPQKENDGLPLTEEEMLADAPQSFDYAVNVSINPEFVLFVNGHNHDVTDYRALNEDARSIEDRTALVGRNIRDAVKDIVMFSVDEGFLSDGGEVRLKLIYASDTKEEADGILEDAKAGIDLAAGERSVSLRPVLTVSDSVEFREPGPGPEPAGQEPEPEVEEPHEEPGNDEPGSEPAGDEPRQEPEEGSSEPRKEEGCSVCQGTGTCDLCEGTGQYDCLRCNSTGKDGKDVCPDCNGTGRAACPACQGTGDCAACGGTGKKPD